MSLLPASRTSRNRSHRRVRDAVQGFTGACVLLAMGWSAPASSQGDGQPAHLPQADCTVIPQPVALHVSSDAPGFRLLPGVEVVWNDEREGAGEEWGEALEQEAEGLAEWLSQQTQWRVPVRGGWLDGPAIYLAIAPQRVESSDEEAYAIEVQAKSVGISANTPVGLSRGFQTLRQLLPVSVDERRMLLHPKGFSIPALSIQDAPRFRWRGLHLDVGRHWFSVGDIWQLLDTMALLKLNVFHWHLTEDQGWRIEIKSHPRLTEVGAFRASPPVYDDGWSPRGGPYGAFYTQEQVRGIVAYAASLHIDVMPEIELPGHSMAAIAAYPELGNPEFTEGPLEVGTHWGVYPYTLAPTDEVLRFYEDVFDEVFELFPFPFVHIGGDEAPKGQWKESPSAQARMRELGLASEEELQAWFVGHFARYFEEHGRRLVGWDEIQEGGLPAGATMMVWRGWHFGVEAARAGHDIVMAPTSHTYFDSYQGPPETEPEAIGGLLPLETVYAFEPVPAELSAEEAQHVLGAQGQLWTEYMPNFESLQYMAFPRAVALSEVLWSPREARSWPSFRARLDRLLDRFDVMHMGYRVPEPVLDVDAILFEGSTTISLPREHFLVRRDQDSEYLDLSAVSTDTLRVDETAHFSFANLRPSGRVSHPASLALVRVEPLPNTLRRSLLPGAFVRDLAGARRTLPAAADFAPAPRVRRADDLFDVAPKTARRIEGYLEIEEPGIYTLRLGSDDGSLLELAGEPLLDNGGLHGHLEKHARITLPAGTFPFALTWFDAGGAASLSFAIEGPGPWRILAPAE